MSNQIFLLSGIGSRSARPEAAQDRPEIKVSLPYLLLVLSASLLHLGAEHSVLPLLVASIYFFIGLLVVSLPKIGGVWERRIYTRVFSAGFMAAGIAAVYRVYSEDPQGDVRHFFDSASSSLAGWTLIEISFISEGALAIVIWRSAFDLMSSLGFPREQYVGIMVNVLIVALSGVVALKMARHLYGDDPYRFRRLIILFSACGLLWLFSGILLRDSVILLGVSLLAYAWLYFLAKPDVGLRLLLVSASSFLAFVYFGFMRAEFVFVPVAMAMAAVSALLFSKKTGKDKMIAYFLVLIGLMIVGWLLAIFGEALQLVLSRGREGYADGASQTHADDSLGMALVVNQPIPLRLVLGSVYLFVFPVPFWSGFQLDSVYHLFKSFNVIYFYFVIPLLLLAVRKLWKEKPLRTPGALFLLFLIIGFTLAIAVTSLETRHHGAFFAPLFLLALLPDMRVRSEKRGYKQLLTFVLVGVVFVHLAWLVLKFL